MSFLVSVRRSDCLAPELHDDSIAQLNVLSEQLDLVPAGPQPQPFTGLTRKGETNVSGELEVTCVYGTQSVSESVSLLPLIHAFKDFLK